MNALRWLEAHFQRAEPPPSQTSPFPRPISRRPKTKHRLLSSSRAICVVWEPFKEATLSILLPAGYNMWPKWETTVVGHHRMVLCWMRSDWMRTNKIFRTPSQNTSPLNKKLVIIQSVLIRHSSDHIIHDFCIVYGHLSAIWSWLITGWSGSPLTLPWPRWDFLPRTRVMRNSLKDKSVLRSHFGAFHPNHHLTQIAMTTETRINCPFSLNNLFLYFYDHLISWHIFLKLRLLFSMSDSRVIIINLYSLKISLILVNNLKFIWKKTIPSRGLSWTLWAMINVWAFFQTNFWSRSWYTRWRRDMICTSDIFAKIINFKIQEHCIRNNSQLTPRSPLREHRTSHSRLPPTKLSNNRQKVL